MTAVATAADLLDPSSAVLADLLAAVGSGRADRERSHRQPLDAMDLIRQVRLGALRVPGSEGGAGATLRQVFTILIRLAEADPNLAHSLRSHFIVTEVLRSNPDPDTRSRWFGRVLAGDIIGNATTEPAATYIPGGDRYGTTLREVDGELRLTGEKFYSTGVLHSDRISVTGFDENGQIINVLIPVDRDGVTLVDDWDGIGQQLTGSGTTRFDNVLVERDELLVGAPSESSRMTTHANTLAHLWLQAVMAGILRSVVDDGIALLHNRARSFSHAPAPTPADDPLLQTVLGRLSSVSFAAEAIVLAAADALDVAADSVAGGATDPDEAQAAALAASQAKVVIDALAQQSATALFDLGGASAVRRSAELDRHWRNIRTLASHNPADYKAQAIGKQLLHGGDLPANGFF